MNFDRHGLKTGQRVVTDPVTVVVYVEGFSAVGMTLLANADLKGIKATKGRH